MPLEAPEESLIPDFSDLAALSLGEHRNKHGVVHVSAKAAGSKIILFGLHDSASTVTFEFKDTALSFVNYNLGGISFFFSANSSPSLDPQLMDKLVEVRSLLEGLTPLTEMEIKAATDPRRLKVFFDEHESLETRVKISICTEVYGRIIIDPYYKRP